MPRKGHEAGVHRKKESQEQSRERFDFLAEKGRNKYEQTSGHGWDEARHEVRALDDGEQNAGQENIAGLRSEQGSLALRNVQSLQGQCRLRIRKRGGAQIDHPKSYGYKKG